MSSFPKGNVSYLLNFAYLTKEKSEAIPVEDFIRINSYLSDLVSEQAKRIGVDNILTVSSGSVYGKEEQYVSDIDIDPYGVLKLREEILYSRIAEGGSKVVIPRAFNVSGPYVYKAYLYMLPSFIYQALTSDAISITADNKIYRSFVAISELISVVIGAFGIIQRGEVLIFDTVGESEMEMGDLALKVKEIINRNVRIHRDNLNSEKRANRYIGSREKYSSLIKELHIKELNLEDQILCTGEYLSEVLSSNSFNK